MIKMRREVKQRKSKTAAQEMRGMRERSASCDSEHVDSQRIYLSMLDKDFAFASKHLGMYSYIFYWI